METTTQLGPEQRNQIIHQMSTQTFDVIVIGGGVTGAGAALDAASRGLTVALLEAQDLASGTSSRSGKTFHGGLRYLQQFNFSLVRQASHERNLMVNRLCPHLTHPTPFLYPLSHRGWERAYMGAGVLLYDLLGGARPEGMPGHRHLLKKTALHEMPALNAERITGAVQYYDVIFDDARHTLTVARTAAHYGALIGIRLKVTGMLRDGSRVVGVQAYDTETGQSLEVRGRCVINAAGVWADLVQQLADEAQVEIRPAKGVHILVPRESIVSSTGFIAPTSDSVLVVRPWGRFWIIGTTDTPWDFERGEPVANATDINYLLSEVNKWLRTQLTHNDIVGVYAGVRPLISSKGKKTAALSREHAVLKGPEGLFTIVGGKYTTYRVMAKDVMDTAIRWLRDQQRIKGYSGHVNNAQSVTDRTPLLGATGWQILCNLREQLAQRTGLKLQHIEHLLGRYGSLVSEIFDLLTTRPELARPIEGASEYLEVEIVYAASHEGALHLDDFLERRTHIAIETRDAGIQAVGRVAKLAGDVLGWNDERREMEIANYKRKVEADRLAMQEAQDKDTTMMAR
ncbi:MAG: glycerol-3-phosphate dehydrogenase/oxidase [Ktedonobacteraceae bacterium]|nr:glycerol-3-phosphate dehydrogenase/oxidase [Ktedonobacteraceae bacterium]